MEVGIGTESGLQESLSGTLLKALGRVAPPSIALASRAFMSQEVLLPSGGGAGVVDGRTLFVVSGGNRIDLRNGDGAGKVGKCGTLSFNGLLCGSESFRGTTTVSKSEFDSDTGGIEDRVEGSLGRVAGELGAR